MAPRFYGSGETFVFQLEVGGAGAFSSPLVCAPSHYGTTSSNNRMLQHMCTTSPSCLDPDAFLSSPPLPSSPAPQPHRLQWTWRASMRVKNDFFQYSTPDCLALGGLGHFAIHVDSDLLQVSGLC